MKKWEYHVAAYQFHLLPQLDLSKPKSLEAVNDIKQLGHQGWELVSVLPQGNNFHMCFFKREQGKNVEEWS